MSLCAPFTAVCGGTTEAAPTPCAFTEDQTASLGRPQRGFVGCSLGTEFRLRVWGGNGAGVRLAVFSGERLSRCAGRAASKPQRWLRPAPLGTELFPVRAFPGWTVAVISPVKGLADTEEASFLCPFPGLPGAPHLGLSTQHKGLRLLLSHPGLGRATRGRCSQGRHRWARLLTKIRGT